MVVVLGTTLIISGKVDFSCLVVTLDFSPCLSYVTNNSLQPLSTSYSSVHTLNITTSTTPDRRATYSCIKTIENSVMGFKWDRTRSVPGQCGVNVGIPISLFVNCAMLSVIFSISIVFFCMTSVLHY
ncbi:hypothetical protein SUGI_0999640 [Cryptomeria japonica]|nr:hypothetical protein SUGI_0999640 [Cryptomeria japonica]